LYINDRNCFYIFCKVQFELTSGVIFIFCIDPFNSVNFYIKLQIFGVKLLHNTNFFYFHCCSRLNCTDINRLFAFIFEFDNSYMFSLVKSSTDYALSIKELPYTMRNKFFCGFIKYSFSLIRDFFAQFYPLKLFFDGKFVRKKVELIIIEVLKCFDIDLINFIYQIFKVNFDFRLKLCSTTVVSYELVFFLVISSEVDTVVEVSFFYFIVIIVNTRLFFLFAQNVLVSE
jgi:hypothetical protein